MYARDRRMLWAEPRIGVPAGVEQHENGLDVVLVSDCEESDDTPLEAARVLLPDEVVQKHSHGVHPESLRPAELDVDALGIERRRLPHLELVDGIVRDVV